jgi:ATP-dependent DNA helicase RecG
MPTEGITYDRKALAAVTDSKPDWNALAKDVVAFAAARGGTMDLGIADDAEEPPTEQRIPADLPDRVLRRLQELTHQVTLSAEVKTSAQGGEFLRLNIARSQGMPSRSGGKFIFRSFYQTLADPCRILFPSGRESTVVGPILPKGTFV